MKLKKFLVLGVTLALVLAASVSFAESNDIGLASLIGSLPQKQRVEIVQSILEMVKEVDGLDTLDSIYQSVLTLENQDVTSSDSAVSGEITLEELLAKQPLAVIKTELIAGDERWKSLYPDMLSAIIQNNSNDDIKNAVIGFVAWDKNGLPIKIEGQFDFGGGNYLKKVNCNDINLVPNDTFGKNGGLSLSEDCHVVNYKAIAISYETFEGKTWENPYLDDFCELYEGKKFNNT